MRRVALLERYAFHEAGHAVVAFLLGVRFASVDIASGRDRGGAVVLSAPRPEPLGQHLRRYGAVLPAGFLAESDRLMEAGVALDEGERALLLHHASSDRHTLEEIALKAANPDAFAARAYRDARETLHRQEARWMVPELALGLLDRGTLRGVPARRLLRTVAAEGRRLTRSERATALRGGDRRRGTTARTRGNVAA